MYGYHRCPVSFDMLELAWSNFGVELVFKPKPPVKVTSTICPRHVIRLLV